MYCRKQFVYIPMPLYLGFIHEIVAYYDQLEMSFGTLRHTMVITLINYLEMCRFIFGFNHLLDSIGSRGKASENLEASKHPNIFIIFLLYRLYVFHIHQRLIKYYYTFEVYYGLTCRCQQKLKLEYEAYSDLLI